MNKDKIKDLQAFDVVTAIGAITTQLIVSAEANGVNVAGIDLDDGSGNECMIVFARGEGMRRFKAHVEEFMPRRLDGQSVHDSVKRICTEAKQSKQDELMKEVTEHWTVSQHCPSKRLRYKALNYRVLAVCVVAPDVPGYYKVYIDAVPGSNHDIEQHEVHRHGVKLDWPIAGMLFPQFEEAGFKYEH